MISLSHRSVSTVWFLQPGRFTKGKFMCGKLKKELKTFETFVSDWLDRVHSVWFCLHKTLQNANESKGTVAGQGWPGEGECSVWSWEGCSFLKEVLKSFKNSAVVIIFLLNQPVSLRAWSFTENSHKPKLGIAFYMASAPLGSFSEWILRLVVTVLLFLFQ